MKRAMKSKRNWKERWFVLRATKMEWYKKERDLKPTGDVPMGPHTRINAAPGKDDTGGKAHCILIEQQEGDGPALCVQAGSDAEKELWVKCLRSTIALQQSYKGEQATQAQALSQSRSGASAAFKRNAKQAHAVPPKPGGR